LFLGPAFAYLTIDMRSMVKKTHIHPDNGGLPMHFLAFLCLNSVALFLLFYLLASERTVFSVAIVAKTPNKLNSNVLIGRMINHIVVFLLSAYGFSCLLELCAFLCARAVFAFISLH
jgi:hypothetical protein